MQAWYEAPIYSRFSGYLKNWYFDYGAHVKKGQVLATIDTPDLDAELDAALDELPDNQRDVFVAHEIEGRSFKELSAETGVSVNTLLSRKHHAVLHLRSRLQSIYNEFTNR